MVALCLNRQFSAQCAQMVVVVMLSSHFPSLYVSAAGGLEESKQQCSIHRFCPDLSFRLWKSRPPHLAGSA